MADTPKSGAWNTEQTIFDQQVPFDFSSGFSGQWVFGPTRIDISTGDITNSTNDGYIFGFHISGVSGGSTSSGTSGFSGFSGNGFSGFSGHSGLGTNIFHQFILMGA